MDGVLGRLLRAKERGGDREGRGRIAQCPSRLVEAGQRDQPPGDGVASFVGGAFAGRTGSRARGHEPERDLRKLSGVSLQGCSVVGDHLDIVAALATIGQFRRSRRRGGSLA